MNYLKKLAAAVLLCALLAGCAAVPPPPAETTAPPTESTQAVTEPEAPSESETQAPTEAQTPPATESEPVENSAWKNYVNYNDVPGDALAVILNEPFDQTPDATVTWREGEYERAYIIPRYVGSYVNLCGVTWDETTYQEIVSDKPSESTCADDGCVIYSALERPEGMAIWYLEAVSPDGRRAGMILSYNGNTGTPPVEYLVPAE